MMQIKKELRIAFSLMLFLFVSGCAPGIATAVVISPQAATEDILPPGTVAAAETSVATVQPSVTPTMSEGVSEPLDLIKMIDETHGWGIAAQFVVRTENGGQSWSDVTPAEIKTGVANNSAATPQVVNSIELAGAFIDAQTAWVALAGSDQVTFFHTADGGQTWQTNELVVSTPQQDFSPIDILSFTFLNTQTGWLLRSTAASVSHESVELYQTQDGGTSWQMIAEARQNSSGIEMGQISTNGQKTGISFRDATVGWLTGSSQDNVIFLYRTKDGGSRWNYQELLVPKGYIARAGLAQSNPVTFFDDKNGIMPAYLGSVSPSINLVFYVTTDGGDHWSATTPLSSSTSDFIWSWPDALHGFAAENQTGIVYLSIDGGKTWSKNSLGGVAISQLDFISATTGWALSSGNLFKTIDGGENWTTIYSQ